MPIQINLLAEAQAAEELRRKDPVKRVVYAAVVAVFLAVLWGTTLQLKLMARGSKLSNVQAKWKDIETEYEKVVQKQRKAIEAEEKLAALDRLTTNRFLWGTTFNALQQSMTTLDTVDVLRLKTEQNFRVVEETGARPAAGGNAPKKVTSTERISLLIEGADYTTPQPGASVNRFKEAIANVPYFRENLQTTNGVKLMTLSPPQASGPGGIPFVRFSLQCFFPERIR